MNRGNIPGYYFDAEKSRYFKIQANHLVPPTAKYSKGLVNREKRLSKKRKVEEHRHAVRKLAVISQAPVLKSSLLGGTGLSREHGTHTTSTTQLMHCDSALVSQWKPEQIEVQIPHDWKAHCQLPLRSVHYEPRDQRIVTSTTTATISNIATDDLHRSLVFESICDWEEASENGYVKVGLDSRSAAAAFNGNVATVSTGRYGTVSTVLACAEDFQTYNVYFGYREDDSEPRRIHLTMGTPGSTIGDSAIHPVWNNTAIIGSVGIYILDVQANLLVSAPQDIEDWPKCAPCINWLDDHTVVYGAKNHGYSVMLWDTRTTFGKTARFKVRDRLTSVFNPASPSVDSPGSPYEILASTNHRIDCFDTRMPRTGEGDAPVMSFPHVHGGPRLDHASRGSLVAAVDRDHMVQVYSTRNGTKLATLMPPVWKPKKFESPMLRNLTWYDDPKHGSTLQAVRGKGVIRWTCGGVKDDGEE